MGEVQEGTYSDLYPYTFLWSSDPYDDGKIKGLNLKTMEMTNNRDEIDVVMNQYGAMAANGIIELEEDLEDPTDDSQPMSFTSSVTMTVGSVYLIATSDDDFAKIRIDSILPGNQSISGRTMVPIRFVSENLDQEISFDKNTYIIQIKSKGTTTNNSQNKPIQPKASSLTGLWSLWVPGGYSKIDMATNYTNGAGEDALAINEDGTYTWLGVEGSTIEGKWTKDGEEIIIHKGRYDWDWNVKEYEWSDGKGVMVYVLGTYYEGRRISN